MESVVACIITYNPDLLRLSNNIEIICDEVEKVIIIDNSSTNINDICDIKKIFENLIIIKNEDNIGIAAALNQGLEFAYKNKYDWLLTLDQDTQCPKGIVEKLLEIKLNALNSDKIVICCPTYIDINSTMSVGNGKQYVPNYEEVLTCITSGSLMNVKISKLLGSFESKLFIDHVDHEFCLKAAKKGYKILKSNKVYIDHEIGNLTEHKFLGFNISTSNHSAIRRYYYSRNSIYLIREYFRFFPIWILKCMLNNINQFIKILLFENYKTEKLKFILKGYKDGIFNIYGAYKEKS